MDKGKNAVLLLSCRDQKGIVASVSNFIFSHGGNIIHAAQHTSDADKFFFMRVEWELGSFQVSQEEIPTAFAPIAQKFNMSWEICFTDTPPRLAIFVSQQQHCLYDILVRHQMGEILADIPVIISNHLEVEKVAKQFGINFSHIPISKENKAEQEKKEIALLQEHNVNLIVLARYMQVLSSSFIDRFPHRIINIHHSFLPAFAGSRAYQQAYERGVKIVGVTSHYVTEELDDGPIIAQDVTRVSHRDSVSDIVLKGKDLERIVLARAIRLHIENRILVFGKKTIVFE